MNGLLLGLGLVAALTLAALVVAVAAHQRLDHLEKRRAERPGDPADRWKYD